MTGRKFYFMLVLAFAMLAVPRTWAASNITGNINGALGAKWLDSDDWDPNDDQFLFGLFTDFRQNSWPISIAIDFIGTTNSKDRDGARITGSTGEMALGVRKVWDQFGAVAPFIGIGPSIMTAQTESSVSSNNGGHIITEDHDTDVGYWLGGGVLFHVTPMLNLGAAIRYSQAEVELFNQDVKAGGTEFMLLAGVHF